MNTKSNLLKSIFISLILVMGVANMSAATITSDGTARLYFNMSAVNWWIAGTDGNGNFGYFFNNSTGKNAWSAHSVKHDGNTYYVVIPAGTWAGVILTRNNTSTSPSWNNRWNQTGDITLSSTSNYISKFSEGSTSVTWGTAIKPASTGSLSASSISVNIGANVTLTPSLTSNQTINDIQSTSYSISPNSGASISGNTFTATKAGTYTVTATITYNPDGYTSLTSTVSPTVTIKVNPWTITWNPNGGSVTPTSSTYDGATAVSLPTPTRTGYNFDGWYTAASGGTKINDIGTTTKPTSNVTYYAHWTPKTYTITLNANGGASNGSATATYNSSSITNITHPTRTDYRCNGYYTAASGGTLVLNTDGTLAKSVSGYTDANGNWTKDGTAALYAQWTPIEETKYAVTISSAGNGTVSPSGEQQIGASGMEVTATPATGYEFDRWANTAGAKAVPTNTAITTVSATAAGTITAHFKAKTYAITLNANGGSGNTASVTATYNLSTLSSAITNPTKAGYTFAGWYSGAGGTGSMVINTSGVLQANISTYTGANGIWIKDNGATLYAKWTANTYTVSLDNQGATTAGTASVTATYNAALLSITAPTKTGYTFNGYFDATSGGTKYYNADGSSAKNWDKTSETTLYAKWTANTYTVTFNANGGSGTISNQSFTYDIEKALTANTFTRKGYEFTGWNTQANGSGDSYSDKESVSNLSATDGAIVTLYAQWNQLSPTTVYINPKTDWEKTLKIICDGEEADMTPVGCDGYYTAEVPGGTTELKFGGNNEQTLSLTVPTDGKVLYDMTSTIINHLYLSPGVWDVDGAWFAAYFFEGSNNTWKKMTAVKNVSGLFECEIPNGYSNVIFVRKNPSNQNLNFDDKWAQTGDLKVPTNGTNKFSISGWNNKGTWHKVWDNSCWTDYSGPSNTYTVTLDRQGATTGSENVTATFGDTPSSIVMPERTGYTFGGYYTEANGEGTPIIDAEGKWINGTNYVDADGNWISTDCNITFYAQWTANKYTVTLDNQSATTAGTASVQATYGSAMPSATMPQKTGYTFGGYYTAINGGGTQYYNANGGSSKAWNIADNTTLYAKWTAERYTITYKDQGGSNFSGTHATGYPTTHTYGTATTLKTASKAGHTFGGWFTTQDCSGSAITTLGATAYTSNITLYAKWTAQETPIYLKPGFPWKKDNARFAIYAWGGNDGDKWVDMTAIGCNEEYYVADVPAGYSQFKFVRLNPETTENNFDEGTKWGETGNLAIPNDGKNLYDISKKLHLNRGSWNQNQEGRYAAYFFKENDNAFGNAWVDLISGNATDVYYCDIPSDKEYPNVIFCRMDPNQGNGWDNNKVWHQTDNLSLADGNYYTITSFGGNGSKAEGNWTYIYTGEWMTLELPTMTISNNNPTFGDVVVKTIGGTTITSGTEVDWDTQVIVSVQPKAGYAVKSSSINIGGNAETIQFGKTYTICNSTTISVSFEEKGEWYLAGEMNNWEIKDEYKLVDGKILVKLDGKVTKEFKLVKKTGNMSEWWGNNTFKGLDPSGVLNTNSGDYSNCKVETVHDGDYLFVWDENSKTLTIEYPNVIFLHGTFNDWKDKASHALHDRDAIVYLTAGSDYEFKVAEKGIYYTAKDYTTEMTKTGDSKTMDDDNNYNTNPYHNCTVNASVTGLYTFHFDKETRILTITYPTDNTLAVGDYRLQYTNGTNSYYTDHVKKRTSGDGVDTVSLFILNAGTTPKVILQRCTNASGNGTWETVTTHNLSSMTLDDEMTDEHGGVWNFIISQTNNGANATVSNATTPERYTGKYYIRTDAADGGWNEYPIPENEIFFSSYARDNEGFDYYYCKYIGYGTNVKYNIANDYNSRLNSTDYDTDALVSSGSMPADGNVRFMWNSRTNELVGRAYLDGSSTENFLRITNATNLYDADGKNSINEIKFTDLQNWIYQVDVQANTNTQIKLKAIYNGNEQFFKGDNDNTVSLLTSNNTSKNYKIRLIYNFKTNHLVCAWLGGDETITTDENLTADMMIIRRDQERAEQLSFNPNTKQLDLEGTAYAVMTFTKAFIQNETYKERQRSLYWVSFPFDVKISDVFGFGEYGEHWILQYYDGAERAKKGLFIDSGTYWKYITNTETILKKGVGYVLALDLNKVQFLHGVEDVSLYFPSTGEIGIIKGDGETTTMEVPAHQCTITHGQMDRRIYDSHWNLIGIPGFTDPGMIYVTNYNNKIPEVFLKEDANLGFHYEFDLATNTYNVKRSTVAFKTMYSYLVQYYGTMEWNISAIDNTPAQIAARRNSNSNVPEKVSLRLEIAQNEQMIDQTFVQLQQEKATAEFDMNLDLTKIINSGANIYTLAGTNRIQTAGNTLPMNNATVPVGVVISKAGEYTFRMPDGTDGILVELIDYETNTTTNLLYDEYTVNLTKGTFENRFALFVRPNNTATSLENINGESTTNSQDNVRKVLIDNILYIVRDGQMFDARGVRVK